MCAKLCKHCDWPVWVRMGVAYPMLMFGVCVAVISSPYFLGRRQNHCSDQFTAVAGGDGALGAHLNLLTQFQECHPLSTTWRHGAKSVQLTSCRSLKKPISPNKLQFLPPQGREGSALNCTNTHFGTHTQHHLASGRCASASVCVYVCVCKTAKLHLPFGMFMH